MSPQDAPRPAQIVKALAYLVAKAELWEEAGRTATLDSFLARRAGGQPHPLRHLQQYRDFAAATEDAAALLRLTPAGAP